MDRIPSCEGCGAVAIRDGKCAYCGRGSPMKEDNAKCFAGYLTFYRGCTVTGMPPGFVPPGFLLEHDWPEQHRMVRDLGG